MKKALIFLVFLAIGFALCVSLAHATFNWEHVGRAPLMTTGIDDEIALQGAVERYSGEISQALALGGVPGDPYMIAVYLKKAIREGRIQRGVATRFKWMAYKPGGQIAVVRDVVWNGAGQLEGFFIPVSYRDAELVFFIPRGCGNLALVEARPIAHPTAVAPPPPPPPVCEAPPPVYAPPAPVAYQPPLVGFGIGVGFTPWCGGGYSSNRVNIKETYISNVNAPVYAPTITKNNGNTRTYAPTSTYAPTNTQSWSNTQSWQQPRAVVQQPSPVPTPPQPANVCPLGQPAGRSGNASAPPVQWSNTTGGSSYGAPIGGWSNTSRAALTGGTPAGSWSNQRR